MHFEMANFLKYREHELRREADSGRSNRGAKKKAVISDEDMLRNRRVLNGDYVDMNGTRYVSMAALARAYKLEPNALRNRLASGHYTLEEALTLGRGQRRTSEKPIDHKGKQYASLKDMAKAWGVNPYTLRARLLKGMSVREALTRRIDK